MLLNIPLVLKELEIILDDEGKRYLGVAKEYHHNPSAATMKTADGRIIGKCLRQLYYKATDMPKSDAQKFSSKLTAGFGNAIHDWVYEKLAKSKTLKINPEVPGKVLLDELTSEITYRMDAELTNKLEKGILEIKTQRGYALQAMIKEDGPKPDDLAQVITYLELNPHLLWAVLVYFGRDSGYTAEYHIWKEKVGDGYKYNLQPVVPDKNTREIKDISFDRIKKRWLELEYYIRIKHLPDRDYKAVLKEDGTVTKKRTKDKKDYETDWQCMYCPWMTHCWGLGDAKEKSLNADWDKD